MKIGRLIVRLREIQRDLYTFYTRVYCEFIVIVENICSAEGTFFTRGTFRPDRVSFNSIKSNTNRCIFKSNEMESEALDTKLTQLEITVQRTEFALTSARREQIKRHLEALKAISRETDEYKRAVELKKIANKEDLSEINKWHDEIDEKLNKADIEISRLEGWLNDKEKQEKFSAQEEQLKFELKLHETKLKLQTELTTNASPDTSNTTTITVSEKTAKLPKLVISKFNGSYMDWPRF